MTMDKSFAQKMVEWVLIFFRSAIGIMVIKVGYDLASGNQYMGFYGNEGFATGVFAMCIGFGFTLIGIFGKFFDR